MKAYCNCSAGRRLRYRGVIIFIWEKASSLKYVTPKNAVKRRPVVILRREIRVAAVNCLAACALTFLKTKRNLPYISN